MMEPPVLNCSVQVLSSMGSWKCSLFPILHKDSSEKFKLLFNFLDSYILDACFYSLFENNTVKLQ